MYVRITEASYTLHETIIIQDLTMYRAIVINTMAIYEIKDGVGIIPEGRIVIEDRAFQGCKELTSIIIPNTVKEIGDYAFEGCMGLTSIVMPDSVTEIGNHAFDGCMGLTSIVMAD